MTPAADTPAKQAAASAAPQVLLVCTANICRSPVAELLWREAAEGHRRPMPVASAGVEAEPGRPADPTFVELMAARGLDLDAHRATRFRADLARDCELILVMEPGHLRRIQSAAPELAGRVQLLGRWTCGPIADPYRRELAAYEECISLLENSVRAWLNKIR
jgi:protein-tyrosine phosphatase